MYCYTSFIFRFTLDDQRTRIYVAQYFREKYGVVLKFPSLPAIQAGNDAKPIYLPMEVCIFDMILLVKFN